MTTRAKFSDDCFFALWGTVRVGLPHVALVDSSWVAQTVLGVSQSVQKEPGRDRDGTVISGRYFRPDIENRNILRGNDTGLNGRYREREGVCGSPAREIE